MRFLTLLFLLPTFTFASTFVPDSFKANFEQTVVGFTGKLKKTTGKIEYKFPGHLRFEVIEPVQSLYVINPEKTWLYNPSTVKGEKNQVNVSKSVDMPVIKFLDSVRNGLSDSKLFNAKFEKKSVTLTFIPSLRKDMSIESVILTSDKDAKAVRALKDFESIILVKDQKSKTTIKLLDFNGDVTFSPTNFEFTPPPNTKIIQN